MGKPVRIKPDVSLPLADQADIAIVLSTISDEEKGAVLAKALVESRLAACINIVPRIRSIYTWKEKLYDEGESLLIIKTRRSLLGPLKEKITSLHPYEVPEIVVLEVTDVHHPYLKWLLEVTGGGL